MIPVELFAVVVVVTTPAPWHRVDVAGTAADDAAELGLVEKAHRQSQQPLIKVST